MYTRSVRRQLIAFGVISALAIGYLVLGYGDGERTLGLSTYSVKADFGDTSGLYPRALVTYRGIQVGRVTSLNLNTDGVTVTLSLDSGTRVPVDAEAEIHSTSAIGEQYVDLVPARSSGPFLTPGATIPRSHTVQMPQIAPVIDKLNALLNSVPKAPTTRLLDQLDTALGSSADNVQQLIANSNDLVASATAQIRSTKALLEGLPTVLRSQTDLGTSTQSYLASLAAVSGELVRSNASVESLLTRGSPALDSVNGLIGRLTPSFALLMANLVSSAQVLQVYVPGLRQILAVYPALIDRLQATAIRHNAASIDNLDIRLNPNDPPPCTVGYPALSQWRDPSQTAPRSTPPSLHCTNPPSVQQSVRGARNLPCPNDPSLRAATPAECGLVFPGVQTAPYGSAQPSRSSTKTRTSDTSGGFAYTLMSDSGSWTDLFTGPLG